MGVATYKFRVSNLMSSIIYGHHQLAVEYQKKWIMINLPPEAKMLSCEQLPVVDLSIQYVCQISHPAFIDGSEIEDKSEWKRQIAWKDNGELYQYNETNLLNFDDFMRKERPEYEQHADGVKEIRDGK